MNSRDCQDAERYVNIRMYVAYLFVKSLLRARKCGKRMEDKTVEALLGV
jgi:hypothetical protein